MERKIKVLFICQHNSGRSQMAAYYLSRLYGDAVDVESAGLEPAEAVHPLVVAVMQEDGVDLSARTPQSVFELFKAGRLYDHVITVCSDAEAKCPLFPGITRRWHWPFPDPARVEGDPAERLAAVRRIRDMIKAWLSDPPEGSIDFRTLIGE